MTKPTLDQLKKILPPYGDFVHAVFLESCVLHSIKYGKEQAAGNTARKLAHIFLPYLNRRELAGFPPREIMLAKYEERMKELLAEIHEKRVM